MDKINLNILTDKERNYSDEAIENMCICYNLKCRIASGGLIFISSNISNWRIFHKNGSKIKIYHENYKPGLYRKKHKKFSEGYHCQNIEVNNLLQAIRYIYSHDKKIIKKQQTNEHKQLKTVPNINRNVPEQGR